MFDWGVAVAASAAAVLLAAAGVAKVLRPRVAVVAMHGLPMILRRPATAVVLGCCEIAVGVSWLVVPGAAAGIALTATYAAFAVYVLLVRRFRDEHASCGCFGSAQVELGRVHVAFNCVAALAAGLAVARGAPEPFGGAHVAAQVVLGVQIVVLASLSYLLLTEFAAAFAAYERTGASAQPATSEEG